MKRMSRSSLAVAALLTVLCSGAWAATKVEPTTTTWNSSGSPYIVEEDVTIAERIIVGDIVTLELRDGCTLSADRGISVNDYRKITINGGPDGTGRLIAMSTSAHNKARDAAIGGDDHNTCGIVIINGGIITAAAVSGDGAGIGGGFYGKGGNVEINGGTVTASSLSGAGIGGGSYGDGQTITINGGTVKASSYLGGGIGGGNYRAGGRITINGGSVEAASLIGSAGIGGGSYGAGGDVKITGGKVRAASRSGVGIGGGGIYASAHGTLSSSPDGSAWVEADSILANRDGFTSGVLFDWSDGDTGRVLSTPTIKQNVEIMPDATLEFPEGTKLTVEPGAILDVSKGKLKDAVGKITNDGTLKLPSETDIRALELSGSGIVVMDGKRYDNQGNELAPAPKPDPGEHDEAVVPEKSDDEWHEPSGGHLTIYIDLPFSDFNNTVSLDGVPLTMDTTTVSHDFGAWEGSTVVTIWDNALKDVINTDGEHWVEIGFKDGYALSEFVATDTGSSDPPRGPGGSGSGGGGCATGAAVAAMISLAAIYRRKKQIADRR